MIKKRTDRRQRIKEHIQKKIRGTTERPRLTVFYSLKHLYAQIVDDSQMKTILSASSLAKDLREAAKETKGKMPLAKLVGIAVAKKALEKNIQQVVFDRNGYMYHGVVKALADGAREGGLKF
jgi:large subunit ribosomal protein L18